MENQVGQILELLERRIPFDGGHVKTPPNKLHEEHRIDIEMVGLDVSGIEKVAANSTKFVDEDEIRNMNDKEPMETLRLRKTKPILTPPNAKTRGTQNCKASQWLRTPFVKFDVMKKRPQLKPSSTDNNADNNIHENLDQLFDNLLDQLGGNVVPEIPKSSVPLSDPLNDYDSLVLRYAFDESLSEGEYLVRMKLHYVEAQSATRKELWSLKPYQWISSCIINLIVVKLTNKQRKKFPNKDHKVWYFPTHVSVQSLHKLLQYAHGEDYVQDVSSFSFQWLEDMPRQENSYDCGLFVIKYMQGKPLPSGVIKFDYLHRARVLLDLVIYKHNSADIVVDIAQYKVGFLRVWEQPGQEYEKPFEMGANDVE
ncbi:hypothetical protein LOK49_LG08G01836 [Camellia lanceoleosa]|uniref:Uncharacterized protein n=1 Tax=Camellia lanceoleosa TaxID=1840588 RepID=A0ACC0GSD8_9ERIC|nr:hypothetical protein LOK49_LG08G01836 [Camellia lanceoleosa]